MSYYCQPAPLRVMVVDRESGEQSPHEMEHVPRKGELFVWGGKMNRRVFEVVWCNYWDSESDVWLLLITDPAPHLQEPLVHLRPREPAAPT